MRAKSLFSFLRNICRVLKKKLDFELKRVAPVQFRSVLNRARTSNVGVFSVVDALSGFAINFVDVHAEGDIAMSEHLAYKWASHLELRGMNLAPTDRKFAEQL